MYSAQIRALENFSKAFSISIVELAPVFVTWRKGMINDIDFLRFCGALSKTGNFLENEQCLEIEFIKGQAVAVYRPSGVRRQPFHEYIFLIEDTNRRQISDGGVFNDMGMAIGSNTEFSTGPAGTEYVYTSPQNKKVYRRIVETPQSFSDTKAPVNVEQYVVTESTNQNSGIHVNVFFIERQVETGALAMTKLRGKNGLEYIQTDAFGLPRFSRHGAYTNNYHYDERGLLVKIETRSDESFAEPTIIEFKYREFNGEVDLISFDHGGTKLKVLDLPRY